jgi:hypothetical protein
MLYRFEVISTFLTAANDGKTISDPRGACYTGSDVTIRFLDPDSLKVGFGIVRLFGCLSPFKSYATFWIGVQKAL